MAIFNDKIVSAQFINPEKTLVEILYKEDDNVVPYVLEVDFTQEDFQDLLKELTLDEIEENTKAALQQESKFFESVINDEIERRWALESEKIKKAYEDADRYAQSERVKIKKELDGEVESVKSSLQSQFSIEPQESKITGKRVINAIQTKEDKDFLFDMKVAILEDPEIAKTKDKSVKLSIRKAKTVMELLKVYSEQKV